MAKPPEPWEFRSKPAWQRLIVMVGGVTVNLLLGMLIYIGVLFVWGREYLPTDQAMLRHPSEQNTVQRKAFKKVTALFVSRGWHQRPSVMRNA